MLIAINIAVRRSRRRLGLVLVAVALSAGVVTAHGAMADGHMGAMGGGHVMDDSTGTVLTVCLAIVETVVLMLGAVALARSLHGQSGCSRSIVWPAGPQLLATAAVLAPRARPPDLSVLQVFRR